MTRTNRVIGRLSAAALGALTLVGGRTAQAQYGQQGQQLVFEWQGQVDRETRINVGRGGMSVYGTQGNESRGRFVSRGQLPSGNGTLYVQRVSGRGQVDVIQQPGYNSGDGVIRIQDPQGGVGYYDIRVYWQGNGTYSNNGEVYGRYPNGGNTYPNNGGYDRDGSYGRRGNDRNGVALDRNGNPVYDRRGNPVYERRGNRSVARDRNGNVLFDRNGNAVYDQNNQNNGRWGRHRDHGDDDRDHERGDR